jgi:hypothetical protein
MSRQIRDESQRRISEERNVATESAKTAAFSFSISGHLYFLKGWTARQV